MQKHKLVEKEQGGQTKEWPTAETETQVFQHQTWKKQLHWISHHLEQNFLAYFEKYNKLYLIGKFSVKSLLPSYWRSWGPEKQEKIDVWLCD